MRKMADENIESEWWCKELKADSFESSQAAYDSWSKVYDQDAQNNGYISTLPLTAAQLCTKYVENHSKSVVLDVGAGTGAFGYNLRKIEGFVGAIDILDANMEMLYVASKREINFRHIIRHVIEGPLPLERDLYDAVMCVGALLPHNCPPITVKSMLAVAKPGGHLIFSVRPTRSRKHDLNLQRVVEGLVSSGQMTLVEKSPKSSMYELGEAFLYVYKKN